MKHSMMIPWSTMGVVIAWYGSNMGVLLLNKYLLSNYGFNFSIFLTTCHMILCSLFSYVISLTHLVPLQRLRSTTQFAKLLALAFLFCFSVVCGNVSLRYIPVSFKIVISSATGGAAGFYVTVHQRTKKKALGTCTNTSSWLLLYGNFNTTGTKGSGVWHAGSSPLNHDWQSMGSDDRGFHLTAKADGDKRECHRK